MIRGRRAHVLALPGAAALALALAACSGAAPEPEPEETEVPQEIAAAPPPVVADDAETPGTPMAERTATLALLNKRNNISQDIEMKPGESRRIGDVVLRLSACERTPPWENPPETGAFVQVIVNQRSDADSELTWQRVFSGWLFKNSPGLNVVEHPIYDVWVKDCTMSFPGEEAGDEDTGGEEPAASASRPAPAAAASDEAPAASDSSEE